MHMLYYWARLHPPGADLSGVAGSSGHHCWRNGGSVEEKMDRLVRMTEVIRGRGVAIINADDATAILSNKLQASFCGDRGLPLDRHHYPGSTPFLVDWPGFVAGLGWL